MSIKVQYIPVAEHGDTQTFEPASLNSVDEALCAYFGHPVHAERWIGNWFDAVGYLHATGRTGSELTQRIDEWCEMKPNPRYTAFMHTVNNFLLAHYHVVSWANVGKRI